MDQLKIFYHHDRVWCHRVCHQPLSSKFAYPNPFIEIYETMKFPQALQPSRVTLLGYGALLSESSTRLTFPHLVGSLD